MEDLCSYHGVLCFGRALVLFVINPSKQEDNSVNIIKYISGHFVFSFCKVATTLRVCQICLELNIQ